jgi:hypothetical protein
MQQYSLPYQTPLRYVANVRNVAKLDLLLMISCGAQTAGTVHPDEGAISIPEVKRSFSNV